MHQYYDFVIPVASCLHCRPIVFFLYPSQSCAQWPFNDPPFLHKAFVTYELLWILLRLGPKMSTLTTSTLDKAQAKRWLLGACVGARTAYMECTVRNGSTTNLATDWRLIDWRTGLNKTSAVKHVCGFFPAIDDYLIIAYRYPIKLCK